MLKRKLIRELWAQRSQAVAVTAVIGLGVLLYVASFGGYLNLQESYIAIQERLDLAGMTLDLARVDGADLDRVRAIPGVTAPEARVQIDVTVVLPRGRLSGSAATDVRIDGRLISIPDGSQPTHDRLLLVAGRLPAGPDEVVVEKHLADYHQLKPGDTVEIRIDQTRWPLHITGVAVSAAYLWVSRSAADPMPPASEFGVLWMGREGLRTAARSIWQGVQKHARADLDAATIEASPIGGVALAASDTRGNQLLYDLQPHADGPATLRVVEAALGQDRVLAATPASQITGVRLLQLDVDGLKGTAAFFPVLFLSVAFFIVAAILGRMVDAQRPLIGMFLALGIPRRRLMLHYITFAVILGIVGTLLGALGGHFCAGLMARAYAEDLGIPSVVVEPHWRLMLEGIALGLAVCLASGWAPARRAASVQPAAAMRPPPPPTGAAIHLLRRLPSSLPLIIRFALRDLLRRPGRNLATAAGVAAALVLVMTTGAFLDSLGAAIQNQFLGSNRFDFQVELMTPAAPPDVKRQLATIPGAAKVEPLLELPLEAVHAGVRKPILVEGIETGAELLRSVDFTGHAVNPGQGLVLPRTLANELHVAPGDTLEVRLLPNGSLRSVRLDALSDSTLGGSATMRLPELARLAGLPEVATGAVMSTRPGQRPSTRRALDALTRVARVRDFEDIRSIVHLLMSLSWLMLGFMLTCGAVLGAAILFNTASLGILERQRELATLRAIGVRMRDIAGMLTLENALLALFGVILGFPLSVLALRHLLNIYRSDLFSLPFVLSGGTITGSVLSVAIVLLLAQWPALRLVSQMNLADAVRVREG